MRRWVSLVNESSHSGQTDEFDAANHHCSDCDAMARGIRAIYSQGGFIRRGDWSVLDPVQMVRESPKQTVLKFDMHVDASTYKRTKSSATEFGPEENVKVQVTIGPIGGQLKMLEFVRLAT